METSDSLAQFFYNIVPGSLFFLLTQHLFNFWIIPKITPSEWNQHWEIQIFFIISFGLFIGFIFQGFTKAVRQISWRSLSSKREKYPKLLKRMFQIIFPFNLNEEIWKEIVESEDNRFLFTKAIKALNKNLKQSKKDKIQECEHRKAFYLMHNYLLALGQGAQATWYTSRLAFWANTYFGLYILLILKFFGYDLLLFIIFLILGIISGFLFLEYLRSMYDSVLKTFVSIIALNKKKSE